MVARLKAALADPMVAAETLLGLMRIDEPTTDQRVGAILVATHLHVRRKGGL